MSPKPKQLDKNKNQSSDSPPKKEIFIEFLEKEIGIPPEVLSKIDIPEKKIERFEQFVSVEISRTSIKSHYPPPDLLKEYEKIKPGLIGKILKTIDRNMEHRIEVDKHKMEIEKSVVDLDKEYLDKNYSKVKRGQWFAFVIGAGGIVGVIICAFLKLEILGAALVGFPIASIISHFLASREPKESKEKNIKPK